ncbi:phenylalanine 4-monooxygenase [Spartinivicinus poritis]|uniref:Phenylalanine-4-hydroxylase n=1 Tax=Spartinivicinus poritis TaxID=2994640 RepID=A0ABT5UDC6_9GAMM|nr:phenylalanine 4-monooxygenase [Spartinivicinus sp. A2-2]MDE1464381.1 phenylalanine 4-monooxygenase [Spartinivicinus sp. A2-2]
MAKGTKYVAKEPDASGFIRYSDDENAVWHQLITRQMDCIPGRACDEYLAGLDALQLPHDRIPQLEEVNKVLKAATGWEVARVPALISFDKFFSMLANKQFPVATFIRCWEELDYLQEPDIFHEIFGHCPMLTHPAFAAFTHHYGKLGYKASKEERVFLARLYWLTVEFGLLHSAKGLRIYGGGILSSIGETQYALDSDKPEREPFDLVTMLRTPYRIDIMQPIYFIINSIDDLFELSKMDLMVYVEKAKKMGLLPPKYPPKTMTA